MAAVNKRELPPKEAAVFRNLLKNYELRQYKKGLKLAEGILKKHPEHGETMALKGLFLNNLEKKEEGYEYVKKGLLKDLTSHICWHVYGLLYRADKNYEEAAKCYANALKFNKNDLNILRDFAILQTQMRHYDALVDTRTRLLESKPQNPPFWLGLAIAYQLVNEPHNGVKVLNTHAESNIPAASTDFEKSELLMYHNMLLEETGDFQSALDHLLEIESQVTDKRSWKEKNALYLVKLGKKEEGEKAYRILISENPHNGAYIKALLALKEKSEINNVLTDLFAQYPRSKAIEHLILEHAEGESFKVKVEASLQNGLRKGIPSLFAAMKKYYADAEKQRVIEELVVGYSVSLEKNGTFGADSAKEPPTALLWTLYYLAKHYDFHHKLEKALELINKAIAHTPTVVELYMTKGRILKHSGDAQQASKVMNEAREMDLQDRFINSKSAKYMLRAGEIEEAERVLGLFTRKDVNTVQDLTDMQCQWFMTEEGNAYLNKKEYGKALKRFHTLEKFYVDYFDDQFDFHTYCLRKLTLRSYVDTLRWEDKLRAHPFYLKAAKGAVQAYLALADKPAGTDEFDEANMSEADKKKARNKARKAALKAQQDQEAKKAQEKDDAIKQKHDKKPVDLDPEGEKYANTEKPLEDALVFVKPLELLAPQNVEVHALGFEIYIRQQKYLLAVKALGKIARIDKKTPSLKTNLDRLEAAVKAHKDLDPKIKQVVDLELTEISKL
ncbi:NMDA receptor-regulated protein 1-domain-containing protein [Mucor mucedo]|uniref:NMDA receptor-regulated protein 1-domain-containing protein n=1 Tax=Mucor mucedo TaxID=29922 RepID=UPI002220DBC4|nr:NMDA receptor-regulated protein 1-domain-containing protein [Mucor mucedo]KAI7892284.1 NMDA receptor-regulated protein 1-domain-containing protein [Mucor mucedo]